MKFSLHLAKYYNAAYNSAPDPFTYGVDEIVKRMGLQLGAIEDVDYVGDRYEGIVIAKVVSCEKHPDADKLSLCLIDDGGVVDSVERSEDGFVQVVCGAPNVATDQFVAWIPPGITVPASPTKDPFVLEAREIRGKLSNGMIASPKELDISDEHEGILVIDPHEVGEDNVQVGNAFRELYGLKDVVIDCENKMFTHRPDCFGNLGIARELAGIFGDSFTSPDWYKTPLTHETTKHLDFAIKNDVLDLVPRFTARVIADVEVKAAPIWLKAYLRRIDSNSVNNIVDYTNYFMMLTGQPIHAFDYDKLKKFSNSPTLQPRLAKKGETLKLLNGKTIDLIEQDIVIATDTTPVALAGIMGGTDTEVDESTKNIVLECANFDMYAVRRSSMHHGIFSDALTRFNKGQSPLQNDRVIGLITEEIVKQANGQVASELFDIANFEPSDDNLNRVNVEVDFINQRLGTNISGDDMAQLLRNVEFEVNFQGQTLEITAPFWRMDIAIAEDVVEEVGRLYGYQNIVATLPARTSKPASRNAMRDFRQSLRERLSAAGGNEVLTYSFVHGDLLQNCGVDPDKWAYHLRNALSPDLQYYRTSLTPSLLQNIHKNVKAQAGTSDNTFALFEFGKAHVKDQFEEDEPELPRQMRRLALVFAADSKSSKTFAHSAYYQAKQYLDLISDEQLMYEPLTTNEYPITAPFQQGRAATVSLDGQLLGVVGEYRAKPTRALKLPVYCAGFEIDVELLQKHLQERAYRVLSQFPAVEQDITLEVKADVSWATLSQLFSAELAVLAAEEGCTVEVKPGSIFTPNQKTKRVTFHVSLSHSQKTLKTELVNEIIERVSKVCHETIGATRV